MPRVLVLHKSYGCDSGCCGHIVEVDGVPRGNFHFGHPYGQDHKEFIENLVIETVGKEHAKDIDFENCIVLED